LLQGEGRREKEEGRRKKEEGRRKKEEGRRKKEEGRSGFFLPSPFSLLPDFEQLLSSRQRW
jgi:hypothetical protein